MHSSPSKTASSSKLSPAFFFPTSKTTEKSIHFDYSALANGYMVKVNGLVSVIPVFKSAQEDTGTAEGNNNQKVEEAREKTTLLHDENSAERKHCEAIVKSYGYGFDPKRVAYGPEDSTMFFPEDVWLNLRKLMSPYVSQALLNRAEVWDEEKKIMILPGPGAELGPLMHAVGVPMFMDLVYKAGQMAGYDDLPITDRCTISYKTLDSSPLINDEKEISAKTTVLLTKKNIEAAKKLDPDKTIFTTGHFLSSAQHPDVCIHDRQDEYLANEAPRAKVMHKFAKQLNCGKPDPGTSRRYFARVKKQEMKIAEINIKDLVSYEPIKGNHPADAWYDYLNLAPILESADGYELLPFDQNDPAQRHFAHYALPLFIVAKQTQAQHSKKPLILHNVDGCYDFARQFETKLSNRGTAPSFEMRDFFYGGMKVMLPDSIDHYATVYCDYLTGPESQMKDAAREIVRRHQTTYRRYDQRVIPVYDTEIKGTFPMVEPFGVAGYGSASNNNKISHAYAYQMAKFLAENGFHLIYGGGDSFVMGSMWQGARDHNGKIFAASTHPLIIGETKKGMMPPSTVSAICRDITERRVLFLWNAIPHMVMHGGMGSYEEPSTVVVGKDKFPELRNRFLMLDNRPMHGKNQPGNVLAYLYAREVFGTTDRDALAEQGVHIIHSATKMKNLILDAYDKFNPKVNNPWMGAPRRSGVSQAQGRKASRIKLVA